MKISNFRWLSTIAFSALVVCGCAGNKSLVIKEPVGPLPGIKPADSGNGTLIVYSGWDGLEPLDSEHPKHAGYMIYSQDGKKRDWVANRRGPFDGDPEPVSLPSGRYWIDAQSMNEGPVKVPLVIRPGLTTVVYLDQTTEPSGPSLQGTNWIRQPNGLVVGWRDHTGSALARTGEEFP